MKCGTSPLTARSKRGLARAGAPDHQAELALRHGQVDPGEHGVVAARVAHRHVLEPDHPAPRRARGRASGSGSCDVRRLRGPGHPAYGGGRSVRGGRRQPRGQDRDERHRPRPARQAGRRYVDGHEHAGSRRCWRRARLPRRPRRSAWISHSGSPSGRGGSGCGGAAAADHEAARRAARPPSEQRQAEQPAGTRRRAGRRCRCRRRAGRQRERGGEQPACGGPRRRGRSRGSPSRPPARPSVRAHPRAPASRRRAVRAARCARGRAGGARHGPAADALDQLRREAQRHDDRDTDLVQRARARPGAAACGLARALAAPTQASMVASCSPA